MANRSSSGPRRRSDALPGILLGLLLAIVVGGFALWLATRVRSTSVHDEPVGPSRPAADTVVEPGAAPTVRPPAGIIAAFERRIIGTLRADQPSVQALQGAARIDVRDVVLDDAAGQPVARVDRVQGRVELGPLQAGELRVRPITLVRPELVLVQETPGGPWNYEQLAVGAGAKTGGTGGLATAVLDNIEVRGGRIQLRSPTQSFTLSDLNASIPRATLASPQATTPDIQIASLSTTLEHPDIAPLPITLSGARLTIPNGGLAFDVNRIEAGGTLLVNAVGTWDFASPGLGLDARVHASNVRLAQLPLGIPDLPQDAEASFDLHIEPGPGARSQIHITELVATAPPSNVRGSASLVIGGGEPLEVAGIDLSLDPLAVGQLEPFTGPLPYRGLLTGTVSGTTAALDVDVAAELVTDRVTDPFRIDLSGRVALQPAFSVQRLVADLENVPLAGLRPVLPWLPLRGVASGQVMASGPPDQAPLDLDISLVLAEGVVAVGGVLDLSGPEPVYDLEGRITGLDLQELFEPAVPPVSLTAEFAVAGSGTRPETADAEFALHGRFTGWRIQPGDTLALAGEVADSVLRLETLQLDAGPITAAALGEWRFLDPEAGGITYDVAVDDMQALRPYLPFIAPSRANSELGTAGELGGTLERPLFTGFARGYAIGVDGWAARIIEGSYTVRLRQPAPFLDLDVTATGLRTPFNESFDVATLRLESTAPTFALAFEGERTPDRYLALEATGALYDHMGEALVRRFQIDLDDDLWALQAPTQLRWDSAGNVMIHDLDLRQADGAGRVALDGRVASPETVDIRAEIDALPLGPLLAFIDPDRSIEGRLWARAEIEGPAADPIGAVDFRVAQAALNGFTIPHIAGTLGYGAQRLIADVAGTLEPGGVVRVDASLPLDFQLGLPPQLAWRRDGPLQGTLAAHALPLAIIEGFIPRVHDVAGTLSVDLTLDGQPSAPWLEGYASVQGGEASVPELNQEYTDIAAHVQFHGETATIDTLRARADGWVQAAGTVAFDELTRPMTDLRVRFDGFRPAGVEDEDPAGVWGDVRVDGVPTALVVTGDVRVDEGTLPLPDLGTGTESMQEDFMTPPGEVPLAEAEEALEVQPGPEAATEEEISDALEPETDSWLGSVRVEGLRVEAGDALWVATDELRLQLAGVLTVDQANGDLVVDGTLKGERGAFTLPLGPLTRRFDVLNAQIRFFGLAPPDPEINLRARRIVPGAAGRELEIFLEVGGTLSGPTVAFTTADDAPIPQSELLSVLLFGQPSVERSPTASGLPGDGLFESSLVGGLTELATLGLEEALLAEVGFPFDIVRVQPAGPGLAPGLGFGGLVLGVEIATNVFLTVDAGFSALFGSTEATADLWAIRLEWIIDRQWRLRAAIEPVEWGRFFRGFGGGVPAVRPERQFLLDLRRRWTY